MYLEEKVDKILELVSQDRKPLNWSDLMKEARTLAPDLKVEFLQAMGFTRSGSRHTRSCASIQGSGLICTCVQPESEWSHPKDVREFLHETPEERQEATRKRIRAEEDPYDADRWESVHG
jgi:hypothetical protein